MTASDIRDEFDLLAEEDADDREERRRRILAGILLAAIVVLLAWWVLSKLSAVPDVVGLNESDAREAVRVAGFEIGDVTTITVPAQEPSGIVSDQSPEPGTRTFEGSAIDLVIAVHSGPVRPSTGYTGLDIDLGDDLILRSPEDTSVDFVPHDVSPPRNLPLVPSVQNLTESTARSTLIASGYRVAVEYGPSSAGVRRGRVMLQDPAPGSYAPRGTRVTIRVSTGPPS